MVPGAGWPVQAKIVSVLFAIAALAGAVIYAQQKAKKNPQERPVFETSKSGTPTPIDEKDEKPVKPKPQQKAEPKDGEQTQNQAPEQKPQKKKKKIMPSSKAAFPE